MTGEPLDCAETFRRLDDYLDRELSEEDLAAVAAHLDRCVVCADEFDVERELVEQIRSRLRRVRMPPDLMARIASRLGAK